MQKQRGTAGHLADPSLVGKGRIRKHFARLLVRFLSSAACLQPPSRPSRLRHRPAPGLPANPQRVGVRESLQVRRLHGHAAWQVVQGGALWEASLRGHWGKPAHMLTLHEKHPPPHQPPPVYTPSGGIDRMLCSWRRKTNPRFLCTNSQVWNRPWGWKNVKFSPFIYKSKSPTYYMQHTMYMDPTHRKWIRFQIYVNGSFHLHSKLFIAKEQFYWTSIQSILCHMVNVIAPKLW